MTLDGVVLLTPSYASAAVCEEMPAIAAAISDFRSQFEVELFLSPIVKDGTPADSYEETVSALRAKLTPGCHIVAMGMSTVALLAANGREDVATLVVSDLLVPPATFRALGMAAAAEASQAMLNAVGGRGVLDLLARNLEGAPEDTAHRLLILVDRDLDRQRIERYIPTLARVNVVEIAPRLTGPTLFLEPQAAAVTVGAREVLLRLVPDAVVEELETWPNRLHDTETGHEFARKAIAFIEQHTPEHTDARWRQSQETTVLFTDLVDSSRRAADLGDEVWSDLLAAHNTLVRRDLARFRGREVDSAGDGFFAVFDSPRDAVDCACAILSGLAGLGLQARAGVHIGNCEIRAGKPVGLTVHVGARIAAIAGPGTLLVSENVRDALSGHFEFQDRGSHDLKGIPGEWRLFAVRRNGE